MVTVRYFLLAMLFALGGCIAVLQAQQTVTLGTCANGTVAVTTPAGVVTCTTTTIPPPTNTAVLTNATASPSTMATPGPSTLNWTSTGGDPLSIAINPGGLKPAVTARSQAVTVAATTVYTVTYNAGTPQVSNRSVTVTVTGTPPPVVQVPVITSFTATPTTIQAGGSSVLAGGLAGGAVTTLTIDQGIGNVLGQTSVTVKPTATTTYTLTASNTAGTDTESVTVVVNPVTPPQGQIWGTVTSAELGECSAGRHDAYTVDGGDGWRYRVWHPQLDPSGCVYGHEHGDNPAIQTNTFVRTNWDGRMGYAARRDSTMPGEPNGHMEPHNGYKVHVVNIGEMNDEGRVNRTATTSMPHMGTGGPARFTVNRHSVSISDFHENGIHHTAIHAMFDTGTKGNPVCAARVNAPTKDGLILGQPCKNDSSYEIWGMVLNVLRTTGETIMTKFVTPAVFDPITVHNPANPAETVYSWDPRVAQYKNFPNDWSGFRGCDREGYSQVAYHYNGGDQSEEYILDVRTNRVVGTANAFTTRAVIGRSNTGGQPPFSSNILQFKKRRGHCDFRSKLSLSN